MYHEMRVGIQIAGGGTDAGADAAASADTDAEGQSSGGWRPAAGISSLRLARTRITGRLGDGDTVVAVSAEAKCGGVTPRADAT